MSLQGGAVKAGMMIARGRQLLMADADGATRVSDLAKLEAVMKGLTDPGERATASTCLTCRCMFNDNNAC